MRTQQRNRATRAGAVGVAALCLAAAGLTTGSTGAYWTTDTSTTGRGTLTVLAGSSGQLGITGGPFVFSNIYPGWTMNSPGTVAPGTVTVTNQGSSALLVRIGPELTGKDATQPSFPATGTVDGQLFEQGFQIAVNGTAYTSGGTAAGTMPALNLGYGQAGWGSSQTSSITVPPNGTIRLTVTAVFQYWDTSQNPAMGDAVKLALSIVPA